MYYFEKKVALLLALFAVPLLFLPKINLISFQSESAGLRIDDLILLGVGTLLFWAHFQYHQKLYQIEGWIFAITALGILSFILNLMLVDAGQLLNQAKIFYAIRLLEYFIFFYVGALTAHLSPGKRIIQAFLVWNLLLMCLQKMNLVGAITVEGYASNVSERVQGVASFPSEMGLILNLLFCYLLFDNSLPSKMSRLFSTEMRYFFHALYPYLMFGLFGVFVILTGNRISILALLVCFVFKIRRDFRWRSLSSFLILAALVPCAIGFFYLIATSGGVSGRSTELLSWENFKLIDIVWDKIDITGEIGEGVIDAESYDMSWWIRIHKWMYVTKLFVYHPECYLQGLGPGFCGAALDGGLLRLLVEYGVIGLWFFWKFFSSLGRINLQLKWMTIAFLLNMIFFDAYLAYKVMSLYLFIAGKAFETNKLQAWNRTREEHLQDRFNPVYKNLS